MTLNNYCSAQKKKNPSLKSALRRMRSLWLKGEVSRFDDKLAMILECSIEKAEQIREDWVSMGFLAYTRRGLLTWRNGGL